MRISVRLVFVCLLTAVLMACLAACGSSTTQHLYVGNDNIPGQILQYTLPITSSSTPVVILTNATTSNLVAVAVDSNGNLATGDNAGNLAIFNAPITTSTTASATFKNGTATNDPRC